MGLILSIDGRATTPAHRITVLLDENHRVVNATLSPRFREMAGRVPTAALPSPEQQSLIGAYFSQKYEYEAAALFNRRACYVPLNRGSRMILSVSGSVRYP